MSPVLRLGWVLVTSPAWELQGGSQYEAPMCCSLLQTPLLQKALQEPSQAPGCFFSQPLS